MEHDGRSGIRGPVRTVLRAEGTARANNRASGHQDRESPDRRPSPASSTRTGGDHDNADDIGHSRNGNDHGDSISRAESAWGSIAMPHPGDLWMAISKGDVRLVQELLVSNPEFASYRNPNASGNSPLYAAAHKGDKEIVRIILDHGADVNTGNDFGETPLHAAAEWGYPEVVNLLIARGADITAPDQDGKTPLFVSTTVYPIGYLPTMEVQRLLLNAGAERAMTIYDAVRLGDIARVVGLLDENPDLLESTDSGAHYTPLLHAADVGSIPVAELLLSRGADIDTMDDCGHTPLLLAIEHDDAELAEFFRARGAWEPEGGWFPDALPTKPKGANQ